MIPGLPRSSPHPCIIVNQTEEQKERSRPGNEAIVFPQVGMVVTLVVDVEGEEGKEDPYP